MATPQPTEAEAFQLGGERYNVLKIRQPARQASNGSASNLAFHFVLDNSGSMGMNTVAAQQAFSPLVDLATAPCSLTIFSHETRTLSTQLRTAKEMAALPMPWQGRTDISEGVRKGLQVVLGECTSSGATSTHHVMVLLSDGDHNSGASPQAVFPSLRAQLEREAPSARISCLVIGVGTSSRTNLGMLFKTALETVPIDGVQPIYFCASAHEMLATLKTLREHVGSAIDGCALRVETDPARAMFVRNMTAPPSPTNDVWAPRGRPIAVLMEGMPTAIKVDGTEVAVRRVPFDERMAVAALEAQLDALRQARVAGCNVREQVAALEHWISATERELERRAQADAPAAVARAVAGPNAAFAQLTGPQRVRLTKKLVGAACAARELRNALRDIENYRCDNSAQQAAFLTGGGAKFANKALRRAGACEQGDLLDRLVADITRVGAEMPEALRRDALAALALARTTHGEEALVAAAARAVPPLSEGALRTALDAERGEALLASAAAGCADTVALLDRAVPALLESLEGGGDVESYLSLLSQRDQLAEWAACAPQAARELSSEYEALMLVGVLGLPIEVQRGAATQVDPFAMRITAVLPSAVDSGSLACARHADQAVTSPEGPPVHDVLPLIDWRCPRASRAAYWSSVVETLTSVTLARDLYMYSGAEQRVALHAHALTCLVGSGGGDAGDAGADSGGGGGGGGALRLSEATVQRALEVLYSIRRHWGARGCGPDGKYAGLLRLLFEWRPLNEAAGVASPVQLLLALCALDWGGAGGAPAEGAEPESALGVPALLGLYNELLSRGARARLRGETGSSELAVTTARAHATLRRTLGVTAASAPQPTGVEESEPSTEAVREGCSRRFSLAAALQAAGRAATPPFAFAGKPDAKTALCVALPRASAAVEPIQALRRAHDPAFVRWPPHVNLLWPFVPRRELDAIAPVVRAELARQPPFTMRLARFAVLPTGAQHTVVLEVDAAALGPLRAALARVVPGCAGTRPFHAHLTVAKAAPEDAARLRNEFQAAWEPLEFEVSAISLLQRDGDVPFEDACEPIVLRGSAETAAAAAAAAAAVTATATATAEDEEAHAAIEKGDALDVAGWVGGGLRQARRVVSFARALQHELAAIGGWPKLMEAMEARAAGPIVARLAARSAAMPTLSDELQLAPANVPRVMTAMAAQAFLHHVGAAREEPLDDVRDRETLADMCVELRMAVYEKALEEKMRAWKAIAGDVTYARAQTMNAAEFDMFIGSHAHGMSSKEFWALCRVMQADSDKEQAFLRKANKGFQNYWLLGGRSTWQATWRGR